MAKLLLDSEFDTLGSPWSPVYPWATDGFTNEDQGSYLVNPALLPADGNPLSVASGVLTISDFDRPADVSASLTGQLPRIGGQILSQGTFSFTYGYIEARMQMPTGHGFDGGLWLLPDDGSWPPEIDVVEENSGLPTVLLNTLVNPDGSLSQTYTEVPDMSAGYHVYGLDWEPDKITWYFDGKATYSVPTPSDMNKPMFIIDGLSSGAPKSWAGVADSGSVGKLKTDYIRVYDSKPTPTPTPTPAPTPTPTPTAQPATPTTSNSETVITVGMDVLAQPNQTFMIKGEGNDAHVIGFDPASDKLDFWSNAAVQSFDAVSITSDQNGGSYVWFDNNTLQVAGVSPASLHADNFVFHVLPNS